MAATHKSLQIWIERESRITRDMIADGKAEEAAMSARILFQTTAKRYHIREGMTLTQKQIEDARAGS